MEHRKDGLRTLKSISIQLINHSFLGVKEDYLYEMENEDLGMQMDELSKDETIYGFSARSRLNIAACSYKNYSNIYNGSIKSKFHETLFQKSQN